MEPRSGNITSFNGCWSNVMKLIDRTGVRYGQLTVLGRAPNKSENDTNARWNCRCDCGKETVSYGQDLGRGTSSHCGCKSLASRIEKTRLANTTHGLSRTTIYRKWFHMLQRCNEPTSVHYHYYGARGIKVCERWHKFENFFSDMGFPPEGMSLDRINNDGDYCAENCRWATRQQQAVNRRRAVKLTHNGMTLTISEWARALDLSVSALRDRISQKFPAEKLFARNLRNNSQPN